MFTAGSHPMKRLKTRDRAFTKKDKALIHAGGGNNLEQFSFHFVIRLTNRTVLLRLIYSLCTNLTGIGPFSPRKCTFVYISCSFLRYVCLFHLVNRFKLYMDIQIALPIVNVLCAL